MMQVYVFQKSTGTICKAYVEDELQAEKYIDSVVDVCDISFDNPAIWATYSNLSIPECERDKDFADYVKWYYTKGYKIH